MGKRFEVTPAQVRAMAGRLRRLRDAFGTLDDDTARHATVAVSGDERVAARLRQFGANWHQRRTELTRRMDDLARHADGAAVAYEGTDRDAARPYAGRGAGD
jgi:hypothetical protein